jgi:tyrosyl-tRNA synthetase
MPSKAAQARPQAVDDAAWKKLRGGAVEVITEDELRRKLNSGRRMVLKLGLDPSAPDLHLGHAVVLRKVRQFQDLGHEAVIIVGDVTARIGDPSGRSKTRPQLSAEQVKANAQTYLDQVFKVMDPQRTRVQLQSPWFDPMRLDDVMRLAGQYTVGQLLARDDFRSRYEAGSPIGLHELFYPLLQGYDSVAIHSDVEFGGTDQTFNLLVGRELQRSAGQEPQCIVTTPLLEGLDGVQKMSKSLGNAIGLTEDAFSMYGKVMSLPDSAVPRYLELLGGLDPDEQRRLLEGESPLERKRSLARLIAGQFHGSAEVSAAEERFDLQHRRKQFPEAAPEALADSGARTVLEQLHSTGLFASRAELKRLFAQGAVTSDGRKLTPDAPPLPDGSPLQVGPRRFYRLRVGGG